MQSSTPLAPMQSFTVVPVHTDDNNPAQFLDYRVQPIGHTANVTIQLDKPAIIHYQLALAGDLQACPSASEVRAQGFGTP